MRRGQPLGTIMPWPNNDANSHVHFEIRTGLEVYDCPRGQNCGTLDYSTNQSCTGNGYSQIGRPSTDSQLSTWGFTDPLDVYFTHRPPYPGPVASELELNMRTSPEIFEDNVIEGRSLALGVREIATGFTCTLDGDSVSEVWYQFATDDESEDDLNDDESRIDNWADGDRPGEIEGMMELALPYPKLSELSSAEGDFCDQAGAFDGSRPLRRSISSNEVNAAHVRARRLEIEELRLPHRDRVPPVVIDYSPG